MVDLQFAAEPADYCGSHPFRQTSWHFHPACCRIVAPVGTHSRRRFVAAAAVAWNTAVVAAAAAAVVVVLAWDIVVAVGIAAAAVGN